MGSGRQTEQGICPVIITTLQSNAPTLSLSLFLCSSVVGVVGGDRRGWVADHEQTVQTEQTTDMKLIEGATDIKVELFGPQNCIQINCDSRNEQKYFLSRWITYWI